MGKRKKRAYLANYTGEISADELRVKILKLLIEEKERNGIEGVKELQHRDLCKDKQGR